MSSPERSFLDQLGLRGRRLVARSWLSLRAAGWCFGAFVLALMALRSLPFSAWLTGLGLGICLAACVPTRALALLVLAGHGLAFRLGWEYGAPVGCAAALVWLWLGGNTEGLALARLGPLARACLASEWRWAGRALLLDAAALLAAWASLSVSLSSGEPSLRWALPLLPVGGLYLLARRVLT